LTFLEEQQKHTFAFCIFGKDLKDFQSGFFKVSKRLFFAFIDAVQQLFCLFYMEHLDILIVYFNGRQHDFSVALLYPLHLAS
jgi:hypothetical protein